MKGTTFAAYIRKQTKTNSSTLTDADLVMFANVVKDELAADIVANVDEHYFDIELYRDLESGVRGYTLPSDILKHMKYCAVKLDGTNWLYLEEAFISQFETPMREETYIRELYASRKPAFYISGRELFILSGDAITTVSGGLKLLAEVYPEDMETSHLASSDDLSIPSSDTAHRLPRQVHKHWATKVIIEYKESRDKPIPLSKNEQRVDIDLSTVFEKLQKRNQVRSFTATVPKDDGSNY